MNIIENIVCKITISTFSNKDGFKLHSSSEMTVVKPAEFAAKVSGRIASICKELSGTIRFSVAFHESTGIPDIADNVKLSKGQGLKNAGTICLSLWDKIGGDLPFQSMLGSAKTTLQLEGETVTLSRVILENYFKARVTMVKLIAQQADLTNGTAAIQAANKVLREQNKTLMLSAGLNKGDTDAGETARQAAVNAQFLVETPLAEVKKLAEEQAKASALAGKAEKKQPVKAGATS